MWTCRVFRLCCSSICDHTTQPEEPVLRTVMTKSLIQVICKPYDRSIMNRPYYMFHIIWDKIEIPDFVKLSLIRGTIWNGYSAYCDRVLKCTVLYKSVSTVRVHSVDTTTHDSDTMFITVTTLSPVQALVRCPLRAVRLLWALILFSHIRRSYDPLYLLYKKTKNALLYSWASTLTEFSLQK